MANEATAPTKYKNKTYFCQFYKSFCAANEIHLYGIGCEIITGMKDYSQKPFNFQDFRLKNWYAKELIR